MVRADVVAGERWAGSGYLRARLWVMVRRAPCWLATGPRLVSTWTWVIASSDHRCSTTRWRCGGRWSWVSSAQIAGACVAGCGLTKGWRRIATELRRRRRQGPRASAGVGVRRPFFILSQLISQLRSAMPGVGSGRVGRSDLDVGWDVPNIPPSTRSSLRTSTRGWY